MLQWPGVTHLLDDNIRAERCKRHVDGEATSTKGVNDGRWNLARRLFAHLNLRALGERSASLLRFTLERIEHPVRIPLAPTKGEAGARQCAVGLKVGVA
jgi:hypothetical protein